jgi:hypothetical protein
MHTDLVATQTLQAQIESALNAAIDISIELHTYSKLDLLDDVTRANLSSQIDNLIQNKIMPFLSQTRSHLKPAEDIIQALKVHPPTN